jgi:PAS domain S-box-containing protein
MTLRGRLLWMIVAVLLPAAGLFVWIVGATYQRETDAAHRRLRETTRALSLVVDRELDKRAAIARTLASSATIAQGDLHGFYDQARAASEGSGNWVVLVDHDDQLLNTSVPFGTLLPRRTWQPDRPLASGDRVEVSNLRIGPVSKKPVLAVFVADRAFVPTRYNVAVAFTPAPLQHILSEQSPPSSWLAAVLDREHTVVARTPDPGRRVGTPANPALLAALQHSAEGFVDGVMLDGVSSLIFYSRSPVHGWTFVMGVPASEVAGAARRAARDSAAAAALLAVFALVLAAWAASRIRRPIMQLEHAARQLARDDVPDVPPTGLAEADAVAAALRRAGLQAQLELTERQQALDELRRAEESQRLLVALHDATRGLHDAAQVQHEIVSRVGRHFGASRCAYGEIDVPKDCVVIEPGYSDDATRIAGPHRLSDFGADVVDALSAGITVSISDVQADARRAAPEVAAAYAAMDVRSLLCVPLRREGRLVALLMLQQRAPRVFDGREATLLEQVAERTLFALDSTRAEAALRESRDVLTLAMRSGKMGAWSRNVATERVWWSPELEHIFGVAPGTFGGRTDSFRALLHPDDEPAFTAAVAQALAERADYVVEFRFRHASGEWRWMEGRGRAVYADDGRPAMMYGLGIDIDARKHAEGELRRLNAELSQAHRRKDEFLATLAHELRNPLAPIAHALEILRLKDPADAEMRWTRDVIERQVRQMTRLVDDLLDVARITRGRIDLRRERVALGTVVHGALEAARPFIETSGHELALTLPPMPLWLDADPTRLTQVLLNLLNNAAKYTPRGGRIEVTALVEDGQAVVRVHDNGIGIASMHLASVFEMFSQVVPALDRAQGGLGIGLSLARGLVELHGGTLSAESAGPGRGSTFTLRLPLAEVQPGAPAASADTPDARALPLRVLVVDDNTDAADSLALMLRLNGHEVETANDGPAALQAAPRFGPDVVLLDIGMPGMNGYEVAVRLRDQVAGQRALLVALTGWGQDDDRRRAMDAGFDHHLTKPVDLGHLNLVLHAGEARRRAPR